MEDQQIPKVGNQAAKRRDLISTRVLREGGIMNENTSLVLLVVSEFTCCSRSPK